MEKKMFVVFISPDPAVDYCSLLCRYSYVGTLQIFGAQP